MGFRLKLFLAILLSSALVITITVGAARWNFHRGFLDYIHHTETKRLEAVTAVLERYYSEHGGWDALRDDRHQWRRLIRESYPEMLMPPEPPPREGHDHDGDRPPPPFEARRIRHRLVLLDAGRHYVAGNPAISEHSTLRPLQYKGETVGWLGLLPARIRHDDLASRFQAQQGHALLLIALLGLGIAAIMSLLLSRHLLRPVRRLAAGTRALTAGDYSVRVARKNDDEFGQLAGDFNTLARTLEQNDEARRRWIADISHELRTPVAILRGEIEAMEDGVRQPDAEGLKSLRGEVQVLTKLIGDLYELSMSDIGALSYRKRPLDPYEVIAQTAAGFRERLAERGIKLTLECEGTTPPTLFADRERLVQLFTNLLENSARYTDSGGEVILRCHREGERLQVDLQDSSPGVPQSALPHLFDRLYRVDSSRNRAQGGAGLGLAICRNIVDAHDGTIEARPSPLGGVWIAMRLPLQSKPKG